MQTDYRVSLQGAVAQRRREPLGRCHRLARRLAALPERVKSLSRYESLVRDLLGIGLLLEPMHREDIQAALAISRQAGLLTNDALLAAVGQRLRVLAVASADRRFERVQNVILYSPDDLPG